MSLMRVKGREYVVFLISEMNPAKMASLKGLDAFVQIACPRLSIDWGEEFERPVLTPYEAEVALDNESLVVETRCRPGRRKHALSDGLLRQGRWDVEQ